MPLVRLTEVCSQGSYTNSQQYTLREVYVNPEHVVMIREEARMQQLNEDGALPKELRADHRFTKLTINRGHTGTEIIVVGAPSIVEDSLTKNSKKLIKG